MARIHLDFETRSPCDIKKAGHLRYAEEPGTEIQCLAVALEDGPVRLWYPPRVREAWGVWGVSGDLSDNELAEVWKLPDAEFCAHNAGFERAILRHCLGIDLPPERWRCTAAKAAALGLPRHLWQLSVALGLRDKKDEAGSRLMVAMCKPKGKTYREGPADYLALGEYCRQDVRAEREVDAALPELSAALQALWVFDQICNDRGVAVDLDACEKIAAALDAYAERLGAEMPDLTGGAVGSVRQVEAVVAWLAGQGVAVDDLQKGTVADTLSGASLSPEVRRVLELRQELAKSSVAKYRAFLRMAGADGRARGALLFHGAATGRWSGSGYQPHNLPRFTVKRGKKTITEEVVFAFRDLGLDAVIAGGYGGNPFAAASGCLRHMIHAPEGRDFICADFANIEGRVAAWIAGEEWKLEAFRALDAAKTEEEAKALDLYRLSYARSFDVPLLAVDDDKRQIGKICIAEGELVLTPDGLVPIEKLTVDNAVWDGVEWVRHTGVVCNGTREVLTYDGLTATPDHIVFTECGRAIPLGDAERELCPLAKTGDGGKAIRFCADSVEGDTPKPDGAYAREYGMPDMRKAEVGVSGRAALRSHKGLPKLRADDKQKLRGLGQTVPRASVAMPTPERPGVQELRGARHSLPFCQRARIHTLHGGDVPGRGLFGGGNRPDRQRRPLRAGELTPRFPLREQYESTTFACLHLPWAPRSGAACLSPVADALPGGKVLPLHGLSSGFGGPFAGTATREVSHTPIRQAKRVYDITNAGPRNRFTVSGRLVHNCELSLQYQGWAGAFASMAKNYGVELPEDRVVEICKGWREAHPEIVVFWGSLERGAIRAVQSPGQAIGVGRLALCVLDLPNGKPCLFMRLPSGRRLAYYSPRVIRAERHGREVDRLVYLGVDSETKHFGEIHTYGGCLFENAVQGAACCLLSAAMLRAARAPELAGAEIVLHVHDEVLAELPETAPADVLPRFCAALSVVPAWAAGCPIAAKGWRGKRYKKD